MNQRSLYIAAAIVHLLLVAGAGSADLLAALTKGGTLFPESADNLFAEAEHVVRPVLGQSVRRRNLWGKSIAFYLHSAGCEGGYNFFAPHVPGSHLLVFELKYKDGRVEYKFPHGAAVGSKVRLASLLDLIGHIEDETVRQQLIRLIAENSCRGEQELASVHAIFGIVSSPRIAQYEKGSRESCRVLYTYDFTPGSLLPSQPGHD